MEITTLLEYSERSQLRAWLQENHSKEKECWVVMSRSKTPLQEFFLILMLWRKRSASDGLTVHSRSFLMADSHSDSPLAARTAIGPD